MICPNKIKKGADYLRCTECNLRAHKKKECSGLSSYGVNRIDRSAWRCQRCRQAPGENSTSDNQEDGMENEERREDQESREEEPNKNCNICQNRINRGVDYLKCAECLHGVHKKKECSGLSPEGIRRTNRMTWKCKKCKGVVGGNQEDGIENGDRREESDRREEESNKNCKMCPNIIKRGVDHLKCTECQHGVHKKKECSGLSVEGIKRIDRSTWRCLRCRGLRPQVTARINEGEEIGDGREEAKKKCKICTNIIKKGADHLICTVCKNTIHKKEDCSDVTATGMRTLNRSIWQCRGCIEAEIERENRRNRTDHDGEEVEYVMQDGKNMEERELRILKWNADTLSTRKEELRQALKDHEVDIFLVQETKMTKSSKVPKFPGYTIINKPRHQVAGDESNRGGGLLTGIRKTVPYKEIRTNNLRGKDDGITEWQTFEVPMSSSEKMRITNLYIPSERVGEVRSKR